MPENLIVSLRNGVRKILFNKPQRKNAFNLEMYDDLVKLLNEDAENDSIIVSIITGKGDFFSSGSDWGDIFVREDPLNYPKRLIQALIDYPKILIAVVNGPAIGIGATIIALCDVIYASNRAYFDTPFIKLGICAEGASTYVFPQILGRSRASESLLLGKRITCEDALRLGLISEIIPHQKLENFIETLYQYGSLSLKAVKANKKLITTHLKASLNEAHKLEFESLNILVGSEEFIENIRKFLSRKSNL